MSIRILLSFNSATFTATMQWLRVVSRIFVCSSEIWNSIRLINTEAKNITLKYIAKSSKRNVHQKALRGFKM